MSTPTGSIFLTDLNLVGVPQTLNFRNLAGFDAQEVLVCNDDQTHIYTVTVQGSSCSLGPGEKLKFPGTMWEITLNGTGFARVMAAELTGNLPDFSGITVVGGGGGGGGAPANAQYLLYGAGVPGALTNAHATEALGVPILFQLLDSGGEHTVGYPIALTLNNQTTTITDGGVGLVFRVEDLSGGTDYGQFKFLGDSLHSKLTVTGKTGASFFTFRHTAGGAPAGFVLENGQDGLLATQGGHALYLAATSGGGVWIHDNGHNIVKFTTGLATFQEASKITTDTHNLTVEGLSLTLESTGGGAGILIGSTTVEVDANGNAWLFDAAGALNAPSTEIKTIADATADTSAPSWGQVKTYANALASRQVLSWGASSTGTTGQQLRLQYGPPYTAATSSSSTDTVFLTFDNGSITAGHLFAVTAPTGVDDQIFTVYKNGVATGMTATVPVGFVGSSVAFAGGPIAFSSGDVIQIVSDVGADVTDVGAQIVTAFLRVTYN